MKFLVELSRQNLADFLEDNADFMEQYRAELETRLNQIGTASVEITNSLQDKIQVNDDADDGTVAEVMNRMGNDWTWLKQ